MKPAHNQNYRQVFPNTSLSITSPNSSLSSKESIPHVKENYHNYSSQPNQTQLYNNTTTNIPSSAAPVRNEILARQNQITKGYRGIIMIILRMCIQRHHQL
jgi:hypothetical protein